MLYKVTIVAALAAAPLSSPIKLTPQFEAEDEQELRSLLDPWLESTGFRPAEFEEDGSTPKYQAEAIDPLTGLPPELKAVNDLADKAAALEAKVAELQSSGLASDLEAAKAAAAAATAKSDELAATLAATADALGKAATERDEAQKLLKQAMMNNDSLNATNLERMDRIVEVVKERDEAKSQLQQVVEQLAAKDSDLAALKAQLEEALRPDVVPDRPAASPTPDGSTPAT